VVWFWVTRSKIKLGLGLIAIRRGFELYECLLALIKIDGTDWHAAAEILIYTFTLFIKFLSVWLSV